MDAEKVNLRGSEVKLFVDDSYQLGSFRDNEDSLRRLKKQASVALDLEFEHLQAAGLTSGARIMDLGCGPGIVSTEIASRSKPRKLVAADCNEKSLAETRRQFELAGISGAEVKHLNVYDERLAVHGPFDFIYSRLVFQHLSDPVRAMKNIHGSLANEGRLCICDIDDRWLNVVPEIKEFKSFIRRVNVAQSKRGGDRDVGTKLPHYLKKAGFSDIKSSSLLVTTDLIGKEAFCDLVFGYKLEVIPDPELDTAANEVDAIKQSIFSEHGWAGVAVLFVSGQR